MILGEIWSLASKSIVKREGFSSTSTLIKHQLMQDSTLSIWFHRIEAINLLIKVHGTRQGRTGYISMLVTSCKYTRKQQPSAQLWEANYSFVCILPYFLWCSSAIAQTEKAFVCQITTHTMRITYIVWFKHSRVCLYSCPSRPRVNENKIRFK